MSCWLNSDLVVLSTGFLRCICMRFDEVINLNMFNFNELYTVFIFE